MSAFVILNNIINAIKWLNEPRNYGTQVAKPLEVIAVFVVVPLTVFWLGLLIGPTLASWLGITPSPVVATSRSLSTANVSLAAEFLGISRFSGLARNITAFILAAIFSAVIAYTVFKEKICTAIEYYLTRSR